MHPSICWQEWPWWGSTPLRRLDQFFTCSHLGLLKLMEIFPGNSIGFEIVCKLNISKLSEFSMCSLLAKQYWCSQRKEIAFKIALKILKWVWLRIRFKNNELAWCPARAVHLTSTSTHACALLDLQRTVVCCSFDWCVPVEMVQNPGGALGRKKQKCLCYVELLGLALRRTEHKLEASAPNTGCQKVCNSQYTSSLLFLWFRTAWKVGMPLSLQVPTTGFSLLA